MKTKELEFWLDVLLELSSDNIEIKDTLADWQEYPDFLYSYEAMLEDMFFDDSFIPHNPYLLLRQNILDTLDDIEFGEDIEAGLNFYGYIDWDSL